MAILLFDFSIPTEANPISTEIEGLVSGKGKWVSDYRFQKRMFPNATNFGGLLDTKKALIQAKTISDSYIFYPENLKLSGQVGRVDVAILIDETGSVIDSRIFKTENRNLNESALITVEKWKFKPAFLDGSPYKYVQIVSVNFNLPQTHQTQINTDYPCEILTFGILGGYQKYENYVNVGGENSPGTKGVSPVDFMQITDTIPVGFDREFGYEFTIGNLENGKRIKIIRQGQFNNGKQFKHVYNQTFNAGHSNLAAYFIHDESDAYPGIWELSVEYDGQLLCSKSFKLIRQ
jgi:TonB family protein